MKWLQSIPLVVVGYVVPTVLAVALRKQSPLIITAAMITAIFVGALILSWLTGARVSTAYDRAKTDAFMAQHAAKLRELEDDLVERLGKDLDDVGQVGEDLADLTGEDLDELSPMDEECRPWIGD